MSRAGRVAERAITFARVRFDAQALLVTASDDAGDEEYEVDLNAPRSEPMPISTPGELNTNWPIYHPRS
jgi:hypothetical protein